jgi:hypothetical protein
LVCVIIFHISQLAAYPTVQACAFLRPFIENQRRKKKT